MAMAYANRPRLSVSVCNANAIYRVTWSHVLAGIEPWQRHAFAPALAMPLTPCQRRPRIACALPCAASSCLALCAPCIALTVSTQTHAPIGNGEAHPPPDMSPYRSHLPACLPLPVRFAAFVRPICPHSLPPLSSLSALSVGLTRGMLNSRPPSPSYCQTQ